MSINDKGIVDTLKECPENGFRMLMMKYHRNRFTGTYADWWFRMMMHRMLRRLVLLYKKKRLLSIFKYMRTTIGAGARANRLFFLM